MASIAGRRVLVVEDDPQILQVIQWALEDEGLVADLAADGQQGVDRALENAPAAVVLDWTLPRLMGDAVAERLRAALGPALPIVLITADGRSAEKAESIGARAYFHKPFDVDELVAVLRRILTGS